MEDTLREKLESKIRKKVGGVLILVLMEDTLREVFSVKRIESQSCLNPCFNGRYSQSAEFTKLTAEQESLNPCFNGRYSQRAKTCVPLYIVV